MRAHAVKGGRRKNASAACLSVKYLSILLVNFMHAFQLSNYITIELALFQNYYGSRVTKFNNFMRNIQSCINHVDLTLTLE